jgi:hypothetical protein
MSAEKYTLYAIILVASIYVVSVVERALNKDTAPSELLIEHAVEKAQMTTKIELLNNKIHDYEIKLLKTRVDIGNMSSDELDSTWATLFD